jgi:VWA domain-containing protein
VINSNKEASHIKPVFKMLFLLFVLFLWPWPALPQEATCEKKQLPVFVTDKDGHVMTTLTSADFIVESRGAPMSVVAWNNDARQHRVVILLDVSGSMRGVGPRLWPVVMALARHASHAGGENNQLALVLFSDHLLETVGFSQGRVAVQHRLEEVTGDTAFPLSGKANDSRIYDVLKEGSRLLRNATSADSFLVITDGIDEGSESKPDEILNLLSNSMIRVFAILVDPFPGKEWSHRPQVFAFEKLVQDSGGKMFGPIDAAEFRNSAKTADSRKAMDERLDQFYQGIFANDVLTIQAPPGIQKPEGIRLFLTDSTRQQLKKAQVFFPHEMGACSSVETSQ